MNNVNSMVICKDDYKNEEEFKNAIRDAIMVILNNGYIAVIRYDERGLGIVTIEYQHDNKEFGCSYPYFLTPDEYESVIWDDERENVLGDKNE